jgi:hypothetical protein
MVQNDILFEQSQINDIQNILKNQLESLDRKYELDLGDLNSSEDRIENELKLISVEERGVFSRKQTDLKDSLRQQQSEIVTKKDSLREKLSSDKQSLRDDAVSRIQVHQNRIANYRSQAQSTIDGANKKINELREEESAAGDSNTVKILAIQSQVDEIYTRIDTLNDEKFTAESIVRLVESEVGPVKYVAEAIYGKTDKSTLERAIRILIIMIVFVFDPLAVALILAYNSLIMMATTTNPVMRKEPKLLRKSTESSPEITSDTDGGEHKRGLLARFHKVRTRSGTIKNFEGKDLAETNIK